MIRLATATQRPSLLRILQHHQTFIRILVSLICLCIGTMTISTFFLYNQFSKSSIQEIGNNVQLLLEEKARSLEYIMDSVSMTALRASNDPDIVTYALAASTRTEDDLRAWQKLKQAKEEISFADSIYIVNPFANLVLDSNTGVSALSSFYDQQSLELIEAMSEPDTSENVYVQYFVRKLDAADNTLPIQRNLITMVLLYQTDTSGSALIVNLNTDFIQTYFANTYERSDGDIVILNQAQQVISSPYSSEFLAHSPRTPPVDGLPSGWYSDHSESLLHVYSYLSFSGIDDWMIAQTIPIDQVFMNVRKTQTATIWFYGLILVASLIIGWMLSRKLYTPIKTMAADVTQRYLDKDTPAAPSTEGNEFTLITNALQHQKQQIHQLTYDRIQSRQTTKNHYLKDLLLHPFQSDQRAVGESFRKYELVIPIESLVIIIFRIDHYKRFLETYEAYDQSLLRYAMCNIVEELLADTNATETVDMKSDHIVAIVNANGENTEELEKTAQIIQQSVEQFLTLSITIAISEYVDSMEELHTHYLKTFELTNERFLRGIARIHTSLDGANHVADMPSFQYPEEIERLMMNELRLGHESEALQQLDKLLQQIRTYSFANARLAIMMLLIHFSQTMKQMDLDTDIHASGSLTQLDNLLQQLETVEAFSDWMSSLMRHAIRTAARQTIGSNRNQELIDNIMQAVKQDVTNPNLSTKSIADDLKLSVIYVRQSFKEATKQSLSDYINEQRLILVQELLRDTDLPIEEIATRTGFSAMNSFYTIFKRKLGRTPTQYRNSQ